MEDTPLWTLPRAIPGWAVLEGAVCIPEATLTQRKGLQPWPYIGGGLGCVIGWEGLPLGSGLEGS